MVNTAFNRESYAKRVGRVTGYLMGKNVQDMDAALKAFEFLARGEINKFLTTAPEAVRVKVQNLLAPNGKPFALDARELQELATSAKESFVKASKAKEKTKAAPQPVARLDRSRRPAPVL